MYLVLDVFRYFTFKVLWGEKYWGKYDDEDVDDHFVFAFDL